MDVYFLGPWKHEDDQDPGCVKSRTGCVITLEGSPLHWLLNIHKEIYLSTLKVEYIALSQYMQDLLPLRQFLKEVGAQLKMYFSSPTIMQSILFEDNTGSLCLATSPRKTPRNHHIYVKYNLFRERVG